MKLNWIMLSSLIITSIVDIKWSKRQEDTDLSCQFANKLLILCIEESSKMNKKLFWSVMYDQFCLRLNQKQ